MSTNLLYFNGINGATGDYLLSPLTPGQLSALALGEQLSPTQQRDLEERAAQAREKKLAVEWGIDPANLAEAGWGVIFAANADPQIRQALEGLLAWRRSQANQKKELYREFSGANGYQPGETKQDFLARFGMGPGPAKPSKVPFYLLIVGSPTEIPYTFQYQLDVQYAVGRIHFDTPDEYARYARTVVEAESGKLKLPRRAVFVGVQNDDDPATQLSATQLVRPLAQNLAELLDDWTCETQVGESATKARLLEWMGGAHTPTLLFTASHGMGFPNDDPRQRPHQGALLCQDYPGPRKWRKSIPPEYYLAGDDLASDARVFGLITFHFACYGAGTPNVNDFTYALQTPASLIPKQPFVARLPQRLLAHPNGGALAVIGHVERAWGYSFVWEGAGAQLGAFTSTLGAIMQGRPVGLALEYLNGRYAELATDLSSEIEQVRAKKRPADENLLAALWTANNDARSYILLGDPAVRLPLSEDKEALPERLTISLTHAPSAATPAASAGEMAAYGLMEDVSAATAKLRESLKQFADKLGELLQRTVDDVTRLEVATYVADDMSAVSYNFREGRFEGNVQLRALTTMKFEGDTLVCVPRREGQVDEQLWKIHSDTVAQAQAYRTELLKAAVAAAGGLLNALKPGG